MALVCPYCLRTLDISGEQPTFCAYCGQRLDDSPFGETQAFTPDQRDPDETVALQSPPKPTAAPERVASFRLIKPLGSGGMGTVYEAEDERSGRRVAVKLIAAEYVRSSGAIERFRLEGRLASTIQHPRCVFVLGADEEAGRPYIVMELMPGETLQELVQKRGPLPIEEALTKILDVIDGLEEAHRRGVVHRDVKPSNCFVEASGRVKVGDFGLSKSLSGESNLTRTGAFVGTPLYASPEQIKGDEVDERTDVYSVAATLYYLLSGRPPFVEKDAVATVARIVLEAPPPLRESRPEIPPGLEAVILRGLDRDLERRYRTLSTFRRALLPFLPGRMTMSGIGLRTWAYLLDLGLFLLFAQLVSLLPAFFFPPALLEAFFDRYDAAIALTLDGLGILYFTLTEGFLGASLGKRLCGLRVTTVEGRWPVGPKRALVRTLIFFAILVLPDDVLWALWGEKAAGTTGLRETEWDLILLSTATVATTVAGLVVLALSMRPRTGFRGPHEWLSGTRVVRLRRARRRDTGRGESRRALPLSSSTWSERPAIVPEFIGPFRVTGTVQWEPHCRVLLGEDPGLGRTVWIAVRRPGSHAPSSTRQELARLTRPRWLIGGENELGRWDAYLAPTGCSLAELAGAHGLTWGETRPILEELVEELAAAEEDGTLPGAPRVDQIWIEPEGHPILVDALGEYDEEFVASRHPAACFDFILRAGALALEGTAHHRLTDGDHSPPSAIHKPIPRHAARLFDRLIGQETPYESIAQLREDLHADADFANEVGRARRAAHLIIQSTLLAPGLLLLFLVDYLIEREKLTTVSREFQIVAIILGFGWPVAWSVWSGLTRGGLSLRLSGLALVRRDNRPAGRLRCFWRAVIVWLPLLIFLGGAIVLDELVPTAIGLAELSGWLALAYIPAAWLIALWRPERGPHDWLAGTYLVPE